MAIVLIALYVLEANGINVPPACTVCAWVWFGLQIVSSIFKAYSKK